MCETWERSDRGLACEPRKLVVEAEHQILFQLDVEAPRRLAHALRRPCDTAGLENRNPGAGIVTRKAFVTNVGGLVPGCIEAIYFADKY